MTSIIDELGELWRLWADATTTLAPSDWAAPTRCDGWSVRELTAHVADGVGGLSALLRREQPGATPEMVCAADIVRALKPNAEAASELAAMSDRRAHDRASRPLAELMDAFASEGPRAIDETMPHVDLVVDYFRHGTTTVRAAAELRVVEAAIHLLDLHDAIVGVPEVPQAALRTTASFLIDLAPLAEFVEAASGRRSCDGLFPLHA